MQKRSYVSYFLILFVCSLVIFGASKIGILNPLDSLSQKVFSPFQQATYAISAKITDFGSNSQIQSLKAQDLQLANKLVDQTKLIADNQALRDQFASENPKSQTLLPADVVGAPSFVPGFSVPETVIINRGVSDGVKVNQAVVYESNLIGKIAQVSDNFASVVLVSNVGFSVTAEALQTQSPGVVNGQGGGEIIFGNVLLSDNLKTGDLVVAKGSVDINGVGFPPGLVIGKITAVSKNPSDLFQQAKIQSQLDFAKLRKVFVVSQ
jgi:rod shape-determining protein MreC